MSNLFDKLSVLVNAHVNDALGRNPRSPLARMKLNADDAGKDPRRSAAGLRQRLDKAIDFEDALQAKVDSLMQEALDLDEQVDAAIGAGDEAEARRWQTRLNTKRQQLNIAESELRDHRLLTRHLLQELSALESALDQQDRQSTRIPVEGASRGGEPGESRRGAVAIKLDETRQNLEALLNRPQAGNPETRSRFDIVDEAPDPRPPKPRGSDADAMKKRLSRLSRSADD